MNDQIGFFLIKEQNNLNEISIPIDRIMSVLQKVGRPLVCQTIRRSIRTHRESLQLPQTEKCNKVKLMKRSYFALPRRIKTATYASEELEWLHSRPKHFKSTPQLRANKDRESDFCKTKADKRRREGERYFIGAHKSN